MADTPTDRKGPSLVRFYSTPKAVVSFSGAELATLLRASHVHYDATCRNISRRGGFLWRIVASDLLEYVVPPPCVEPHDPVDGKEAEDAALTQACRERGEVIVEAELSSRDIDTLLKITEFGTPFREGCMLHIPLRRVFNALQDEYRRINAPEKEEKENG